MMRDFDDVAVGLQADLTSVGCVDKDVRLFLSCFQSYT